MFGLPQASIARMPRQSMFDQLQAGISRDLFAGSLIGYHSGRLLSVADAIKELRGFDLVCNGCPEDGQPCHGAVLSRIANQPEQRRASKPESAGQKQQLNRRLRHDRWWATSHDLCYDFRVPQPIFRRK